MTVLLRTIVCVRVWVLVGLAVFASACGNPQGGMPGMTLTGDVVAALPLDWSFAAAVKEIAIEVETPYFFRHSVTIWCVAVDGKLYVASLDPESKHWPGWVRRDPEVRLGIAGKIYPVRLRQLENSAQIERIAAAYNKKYDKQMPPPGGEVPAVRYWQVMARS